MTSINIAVSKAQENYAVDFTALPQASQDFIINYGLRQYLNDAVAGIKPDQTAEAQTAVANRMQQLTSGTVGVRAVAEKNPVKAEAKREVLRALKAKGIKADTVENLDEIVTNHATKHEARLKKIVELRNTATDVELDIE